MKSTELKHRSMLQMFFQILGIGKISIMPLLLVILMGYPQYLHSKTINETLNKEEAVQLGEEFGIVVGEVDEEIREYLGLQQAQGVVVFEVLGGKPAELAGIKPKTLIKEIDSKDIKTLEDFGRALKTVLSTENFTITTYEPPHISDQGISGGINFHFVRTEKS